MTSEMKAVQNKKILAMVLAGGEGTRLRPLTLSHAKPALPFGGNFRIVDFVLSNLVNSGIDNIYLLAQYKPDSLIKHVNANWNLDADDRERFIRVVLPHQEHGGCFRGTADAVCQNLDLIRRHAPDMVAVFAADHVYRMDVRQMALFHSDCGADVTIAATQVPIKKASAFGVIAAGHNGEIWDFQEKPEAPIAMPTCSERAYASMGNYLFNTDVLVEALEHAVRCGETDFGGHILPRLIRSHHVHAYDFSSNKVPGVQDHEESGYWRDVGTLEAYLSAHDDVAGSMPRFNLYNPHWPMQPAQAALETEPVPMHRKRGSVTAPLYALGSLLPTEFEALQAGRA